MKTHVEIVTGFLGSGKTSFINALLSETRVEGEKILIFQLENGIKKVLQIHNPYDFVKLIEIEEIRDIREKMIYSINKYRPNRIIIEYNGTSNLKELTDILNQKCYKEICKITTIYFVADGRSLSKYIDNVGRFLIPFIQYSNMIVINNIEHCDKKNLDEGFKKVQNINPKAYILKVNNKYILKSALKDSRVLDNGYLKKLKIKLANNQVKLDSDGV